MARGRAIGEHRPRIGRAMSSSGLAIEQVIDTTPLKVHRRVRCGECDPAGVVYTVNFCEYVASAFELFMAELLGGPLQTMKQRHGLATPARALTLEFTGPLRPDEEFVMTVAVADVRTSYLRLDHRRPQQERPRHLSRQANADSRRPAYPRSNSDSRSLERAPRPL